MKFPNVSNCMSCLKISFRRHLENSVLVDMEITMFKSSFEDINEVLLKIWTESKLHINFRNEQSAIHMRWLRSFWICRLAQTSSHIGQTDHPHSYKKAIYPEIHKDPSKEIIVLSIHERWGVLIHDQNQIITYLTIQKAMQCQHRNKSPH
jgi:predicted NACHT family NTPase